MRIQRCALAAVLWAVGSAAMAQPVSSVITYQGQLKSGGAPANGDFAMTFNVFDALVGGTLLWDESYTVTVTDGLFTRGVAIPPFIFNGNERYLEVVVGGTPLTPRQRLAPTPYAMYALGPWVTNGTSLVYNDGDVGIGPGNPGNTLSVAGGVTVDRGGLNNGGLVNGLRFGGDGHGEGIASKKTGGGSENGLDFYTNNAQRMHIANGGNVGIGTTTPGAKFQVDDGAIRIRNNADNKAWELSYDATDNYFFIDEFGTARRFVIENGGNVGIGTTNPARHLVVKSPPTLNESTFVQIDSGGVSAQYSTLELMDRGVVKWEVGKTNINEFYIEEPGIARRFMIEPGTGHVGIGTTNPNRHLVVKSPPSLNENTWIQIDSGGTGPQYSGLELMDRGAAKWEVGKTPSNEFYVEEPGIARRLTIQPGTGDIELTDDASISGVDEIIGWNDLRFYGDAFGGPDMFIQPGGNVGIGTTTPANKLTVNGVVEALGGVRFGDGTTQFTAGGGGGGGGPWSAVGDDIHNLNLGNVGIGLNNPGSKLEVAGGVRALAGNPTGTPADVNSGYGFSGAPNSGLFAGGTTTVSLYQAGERGLMVTPTGIHPEPSVHIGIDDVFDALIQTGRLNVRGLFDEFAGTAITASGGDGWPAIHVSTGGDDAVGIFVQGSLGENSIGVHATGDTGLSGDGETYGVFGFSGDTGVNGTGTQIGVEGVGLGFGGAIGVRGEAPGVAIHGDGGIGVRATGKLYALWAELPDDPETPVGHAVFASVEDTVNDFAGTFHGKVHVDGMLTKAGGTFRIDHPLDPENKFLSHSFVESPDMMNVYNGNVVTDARGEARVELPEYFEALNRDFRYQLTVVDAEQFAQVRILRKIQDNVFAIKTDRPGVEVSWQVTGVRKDPWAEQNRVRVEEDKPESQRGLYLNAAAYGQPPENSVAHHQRETARAAAAGTKQQPTAAQPRE